MRASMSRSSFLRSGVLLIGILCVSFLASTQAEELRSTDRQARVRVKNLSRRTIIPGSINVIHKYSDKYKNNLTFSKGLRDGEVDDAGGKNIVHYRTGWDTIGGFDWWYITWVFADTKAIYQSDPSNFRCALAELQGIGPDAIAAAAGVFASAAACGLPPGAGCANAVWAGPAATIAANYIAKELMNKDTCAFKMCTLKTEDANTWVEIIIFSGIAMSIKVQSGSCHELRYKEIEIRPNGRIDIDSMKMTDWASERVPDVAENDEGVNAREGIPELIEYARDKILM